MIIKSKENVPYQVLGIKPAPDNSSNRNDDIGRELGMFDAEAVSILQSVFECSGHGDVDKHEGLSKTARVKFMITIQDEIGLRNLGYSQAQIDKIKPQEAMDILQSGTKAEPVTMDESK